MSEDYLLAQFTRMADEWAKAGRPEKLLISGDKTLLIARVWEATAKQATGVVAEFISTSYKVKGGAEWFDTFLMQRSCCSVCFETYKVENLSICPKCESYYCPRCGVDCACGLRLIG